jgi:drug/metabolite transporter (DMT)-like permease
LNAHKPNEKVGHLLLGIAILTWGANFGITKSAFAYLGPIPFAAMRFTAAGILVLLITYWKEKSLRIRKEDLGRVVLVGVAGLSFYQILWSLGLNLTSATNSALILSTQPLLGFLYLDLVKKETMRRGQYLNMLIALSGVALVILKPGTTFHFSADTLTGDLLTLAAGYCSTVFFSIWSKPLLKSYSSLRLMGYFMISASLSLWIATLVSSQGVAWAEVNPKAWWALGYAIVFSGILGHVFWYEGLDRIGVARSFLYLYFMPICAALFNFFFMGEKILLQQVLGGALILLSVRRALKS